MRALHGIAASVAAGLFGASCGFWPVSPTSTGGEVLKNTEGAMGFRSRAFTLSPDGRWLLFSLKPDRPTEYRGDHELAGQQLDAHRIYDLRTQQAFGVRRTPEVDEWLKRTGVFFTNIGCWAEQPLRVYIWGGRSGGVEVEPGSESPTWRLVPADQVPCQWPRESHTPQQDTVLGEFRIGWEEKVLVIREREEGGRVYARYDPIPLIGSRVRIDGLALSDDGRSLAYVVDKPTGSFVGKQMGFFVSADSDSPPHKLAGRISDIQWGKGGWLYGNVMVDSGPEKAWAIARWKLLED